MQISTLNFRVAVVLFLSPEWKYAGYALVAVVFLLVHILYQPFANKQVIADRASIN
jgi:hypothetical protein